MTAVELRRFRIEVANCLGCGREWPGHLERCLECAAVLGERRSVDCARVLPPAASPQAQPSLAIVLAIELARRTPPERDEWAESAWEALAPRLSGAHRVRPGSTGAIVAAWPLQRADSLNAVAELALELAALFPQAGAQRLELRSGIGVGVIGGRRVGDPVERHAERLALAAAPGQCLVSEEVARRLEHRFLLRPVGVVPRWPMPLLEGHRALVAPLPPPVLPSAVEGEVPDMVLGRADEQRRLLRELAAARSGHRQVVVVSAPAGGGKSHLLRRVLADGDVAIAAGVAFPPLGSRSLDPLLALLADLGGAADGDGGDRLGETLARAATRRARLEPSVIVIDDVHWATPEAVAALARAIAATAADVPLAWILSMRTSALASLEAVVGLADARVELAPLARADREKLLSARLGALPETVRRHVADRPERGNPLYLEHLAAAIREGSAEGGELPRTLHEAVLTRLDGLVRRARQLTRWPSGRLQAQRDLERLEREVGDWLDRLETSDIADLATIGRYLARLRAVDVELVVARSILRMPVAANRRLAWALERLASASTDALLDYLTTVAREGRAAQAASDARAAAERAERTMRLADAERLLTFAGAHDEQPELARRRGDLALALGRPLDALRAYGAAAGPDGRDELELQRRMARAEALLDRVEDATSRLQGLLRRAAGEPRIEDTVALDLSRLRGSLPPPARGPLTASAARRAARTRAWAHAAEPAAAREAIGRLVLDGEASACAAELVETATLARLARVEIQGLDEAARRAAQALANPRAQSLLTTDDVARARRTFLHWEA